MLRIGILAVACTVFLGCVAALCAQEQFAYEIANAPSAIRGPTGSMHDVQVRLVLRSSNVTGDQGPQGWSLGVRNRGIDIVSVTTAGTAAADVSMGGLRNTGFEVFERVNPDRVPSSGPLAGMGPQGQGCVQAIVLSFIMPITLPPNSSSVVGLINYQATVGDADATATIQYINGLQGSGQPVNNDVTFRGQTRTPTLGSASIPIGPVPPGGTALKLGTEDDPDAEQIGVCATDEAQDEFAVAAYIGPENPADVPPAGAQGWSFGVEHTPADLELVSATTMGTAAANFNDNPPGLRNTGFEVTEIVNPARQNPAGREGIVSAVVLSFIMPITLPNDRTSKVLRARYRVEAAAGEALSTEIRFANGLIGSGQPVQTVLTIRGQTVEAALMTTIRAVHDETQCVQPPPSFLRGDANNDARVNIADPIYTINRLVRRGPPFACEKAADSNDDGMVDLSDAMYTVAYQFRGGPAPPDPFVVRPARGAQCEGPDPTDDALTCESPDCD